VVEFAPWVGAATAGGFIYLALADLMPELHREHRVRRSALHLAVLLAGLALMASLTLVE
jgi:zinc transporter ZupT